ncbi:protein of unknown function [Agreia sp. COWG]|nr:protein of unknown function [Agreia sp. COWG]
MRNLGKISAAHDALFAMKMRNELP